MENKNENQGKYSNLDVPDKYLRKFFGDSRFDTGLDIGCSKGRTAITFSNNVDVYHCVEIKERYLDIFKKRPEYNENKYRLKLYDGKKLPYDDSFFDFISMITVYEHIPADDSGDFLKEVFRVLKPGGTFLIQNDAWFYGRIEGMLKERRDPTHINMKTPGFLEKELKKTGFEIVKKANFPAWKYGKFWEMIIPSFLATKGTFICIKEKK